MSNQQIIDKNENKISIPGISSVVNKLTLDDHMHFKVFNWKHLQLSVRMFLYIEKLCSTSYNVMGQARKKLFHLGILTQNPQIFLHTDNECHLLGKF